jgi:hypothetical protein
VYSVARQWSDLLTVYLTIIDTMLPVNTYGSTRGHGCFTRDSSLRQLHRTHRQRPLLQRPKSAKSAALLRSLIGHHSLTGCVDERQAGLVAALAVQGAKYRRRRARIRRKRDHRRTSQVHGSAQWCAPPRLLTRASARFRLYLET